MTIKSVSVDQAHAALDSGGVYLDVRTEAEFAQGHPAGALNIPVLLQSDGGMQPNHDFATIAERVLDKEAVILCGCKVGGRSAMAAEILNQLGYRDVSNVVGGFSGGPDPMSGARAPGWSERGLPVDTVLDDDRTYAGLRRRAGV